ncbi:MAG: type II toxin-antitoxin system mRNA interferase toxin, RelE/StbE family [Candidatus Kuenenia sp.]|nr:type II toxin-antitoxin system mRNA interferase toxin, RelE/StbE family [Candidatus Kuenenia hertensis]
MKIVWDQGFKRIYKKKIKYNDELKNKFWEAITLFSKTPFNPRLKTHKLVGKLEGFWAFSIAYDHRVVFKFIEDNEVLLIDIGTHDEVY